MRIAAAACLLTLCALSSPARAQAQDQAETENTARARALFSEGVELAADAQYAEAAMRFRAAYALRQAPAVAYNLAAALVQMNELLEASELVRTVLADENTDDGVRARATDLRRDIDGRFGRLTVSVDGDRAGATVMVDGRALSSGELGVPIPMNPGDHVVTAERNDVVLERTDAPVVSGETATVTLSAANWPGNAEAVVPVETDVDLPPDDASAEGGSILGAWWFWTIIGVVVVTGVTVGIVVAASGEADPFMGNTNPAVLTF